MCHGRNGFPAWIRGLIAFEMARLTTSHLHCSALIEQLSSACDSTAEMVAVLFVATTNVA